jgi:hypothetical protein
VQIEMGLTNFLVQLTSFIGREREIIDVERLLFSAHLVTLTGIILRGQGARAGWWSPAGGCSLRKMIFNCISCFHRIG